MPIVEGRTFLSVLGVRQTSTIAFLRQMCCKTAMYIRKTNDAIVLTPGRLIDG